MPRNPNPEHRSHAGTKTLLILIMILLTIGSGFMLYLCINIANYTPEAAPGGEVVMDVPTEPSTEAPTEETTEPPLPDPEHVVSTATIAATGDVLMHMPVVNTGLQKDGSYNFDSIFRYLEPYADGVDYAVANLETTLCGTDNGYPYHGYPNFNCPDEIVYSARDAGFDMFLTANNHSYDTGLVGYKRTLDVIRDAGMETLGTMKSPEEPKYTIQEINGIKIGMLCYTYAYSVNADGCPSLNGMPHISEAGICNYFHSDSLDTFYTEVDSYMLEMEEAGAEATIMFIHWGVEYQTQANDEQKAIAQKLCDLGICDYRRPSPCGAAHFPAGKHRGSQPQDRVPLLHGQRRIQPAAGQYQLYLHRSHRGRCAVQRHLLQVFRRNGASGRHGADPLLGQPPLHLWHAGIQHSPPGSRDPGAVEGDLLPERRRLQCRSSLLRPDHGHCGRGSEPGPAASG